MSDINWSDLKSPLTQHFTVKDAIWLPAWSVAHVPSETEKVNIISLAHKMELVREFLGKPILVHCWIRPVVVNAPATIHDRKNYNAAIGGAPGSAHIEGMAVDWNPTSMTCAEARYLLIPELERLQLRMENKEGPWVHLDSRQPLQKKPRFFRP